MATHTPGPWFARRNGSTDPTGTVTEWQTWTVHASGLPVVATLDETDYGPAATTANARLIAAAPALLSALASLVAAHDEPRTLTADEWDWARQALRAAGLDVPDPTDDE